MNRLLMRCRNPQGEDETPARHFKRRNRAGIPAVPKEASELTVTLEQLMDAVAAVQP